MSITLAQAQTELAIRQAGVVAAEKTLAVAQHEEDQLEWKKIRAACREAKDKCEQIKRRFASADDRVRGAQLLATEALELVEAHTRPSPEEFPSDEELAAWEREHVALLVRLKTAREERHNAITNREPLRVEAVNIAQEFEQLQWSERNARAKANGNVIGEGWKGGIAQV